MSAISRRWQRRVAAIFQDFVHYELPAADNVTVNTLCPVGCPTTGMGQEVLAEHNPDRRITLSSIAGVLGGDTDWGSIMATSVIYTLPVVIVFIVLRKYLMSPTTAGAVKG